MNEARLADGAAPPVRPRSAVVRGPAAGAAGREWHRTLVLPVAIVAGTVLLRFLTPGAYERLVVEDGAVEWATAAGYAAAMVIAGVIAVRLRSVDRPLAVAFGVLAIGFLLVAGEEASWGQRVLGFHGPERLVELNRQDEANLHNLLENRVLHAIYIAVGIYGGFAARRLLPSWLGVRRSRRLAPRRDLAGWFFAPAALYLYYDYGSPLLARLLGDDAGWRALGIGRAQEVAELVLCVGFLRFLTDVLGTTTGDAAA